MFLCNTSVFMARGRGDAERAPLLATTECVECELGNVTVDREEEGADASVDAGDG